jgi:hypothetical protein
MPTATGAASFLGLCGDASNENKTQGEAKTTPTCNAPHHTSKTNGTGTRPPRRPPTQQQDRSDRSNSNRIEPGACLALLPPPAKWWSGGGESTWNFSLKNQNQNHRGNKEFVPHVRFPSSLSLMFLHLPPSAEVEVEPQPTESPLASPPACRQQPVSHTPRKAGAGARTRSIDRSIHESSSPRTLAVCIVLVPLPTRASVFTRHQPASDTVLLPATAMHATLLNGCYCR